MAEAKDRNKEEIRKLTDEIVDEYFASENHEEVIRLERAVTFLQSERGRFILSQALHYAIKELSSIIPDVYQEKSNIEDMIYFRNTLFTATILDDDENICPECERVVTEEMGGKCHSCNAKDFS